MIRDNLIKESSRSLTLHDDKEDFYIGTDVWWSRRRDDLGLRDRCQEEISPFLRLVLQKWLDRVIERLRRKFQPSWIRLELDLERILACIWRMLGEQRLQT